MKKVTLPADPAVSFPNITDTDGNVLTVSLSDTERSVTLSDRDRDRILRQFIAQNPEYAGTVSVGALGKVLAWRTVTPMHSDILASFEDEDGNVATDKDGNVLTFSTTKDWSRYSVTFPAPTDEDGNYLNPAGQPIIAAVWGKAFPLTLGAVLRQRDAKDEDGNVVTEDVTDEDGNVLATRTVREDLAPAGYVTHNVTREDGSVLAWENVVTPCADGSLWRLASHLK